MFKHSRNKVLVQRPSQETWTFIDTHNLRITPGVKMLSWAKNHIIFS